jgi:hypothetical protein
MLLNDVLLACDVCVSGAAGWCDAFGAQCKEYKMIDHAALSAQKEALAITYGVLSAPHILALYNCRAQREYNLFL